MALHEGGRGSQLKISIFISFSIKFLINQAECVHNSDTYMDYDAIQQSDPINGANVWSHGKSKIQNLRNDQAALNCIYIETVSMRRLLWWQTKAEHR